MRKAGRCPKKKDLLEDAAKNWLAHDGIWFQAVERAYGLQEAIKLDTLVWQRFSQVEASRILKRLGVQPGGGIPALIKALRYRLYAYLNKQEVIRIDRNRCIFRMNTCRVQEARRRQGLADFPCKPVGLVEYSIFAETIDPRIKTKCITCPPDPHPPGYWCAWEFSI
jgi:hypothetical protein